MKQDRDFVSITVSNDGALIDRVQAQQLFLTYTESQHEYSTGIGLSIACSSSVAWRGFSLVY